MNSLSHVVLPWWARWAALAAICAVIFLLGQLHGERVAGEVHLDYVSKQAAQTVKIVQAQARIVTQTETKYRDRIQKIYIQGDQIEKQVPIYITKADDAACSINAGFVRSYNAAWAGEPAGPASESDREPSGLPLASVAEADTHNATSCHVWREQALGWREFYAGLQKATNAPP